MHHVTCVQSAERKELGRNGIEEENGPMREQHVFVKTNKDTLVRHYRLFTGNDKEPMNKTTKGKKYRERKNRTNQMLFPVKTCHYFRFSGRGSLYGFDLFLSFSFMNRTFSIVGRDRGKSSD